MTDWKCIRPAPPEGGGPRGDLALLSRHPLAAGRKVIDGPKALESDLPAHQVLPKIRACSVGICSSLHKVAKRFDLVLVVGWSSFNPLYGATTLYHTAPRGLGLPLLRAREGAVYINGVLLHGADLAGLSDPPEP